MPAEKFHVRARQIQAPAHTRNAPYKHTHSHIAHTHIAHTHTSNTPSTDAHTHPTHKITFHKRTRIHTSNSHIPFHKRTRVHFRTSNKQIASPRIEYTCTHTSHTHITSPRLNARTNKTTYTQKGNTDQNISRLSVETTLIYFCNYDGEKGSRWVGRRVNRRQTGDRHTEDTY